MLEYYHYLWQRTRGVSPDLLLQNLPPSLRTTVCQYMYSTNISTCLKLLNYNKRFVVEERDKQGFYRLLSSYIKPIICMSGNVICRFVSTSQNILVNCRSSLVTQLKYWYVAVINKGLIH